jgi:poly(A) polymerase Pap1
MSEVRELLVLVGRKRAGSDAEASRCRAFSVLSNWNAPTIIALRAATASALAMGIWA